MSVGLGETKEYEHSIDPVRVRNELVRYLTTACNYVRRQGLTEEDVERTVRDALAARATVAPFKPELLDRGINDMRVNRDLAEETQ